MRIEFSPDTREANSEGTVIVQYDSGETEEFRTTAGKFFDWKADGFNPMTAPEGIVFNKMLGVPDLDNVECDSEPPPVKPRRRREDDPRDDEDDLLLEQLDAVEAEAAEEEEIHPMDFLGQATGRRTPGFWGYDGK